MAFRLDDVVPWGRSYEEYVSMFALTGDDLNRSILGCSDGPASFNGEQAKRGGRIVSVDPLYGFDREAIRQRIECTFHEVLAQVRENQEEFVWSSIGSPAELGEIRMAAMKAFLEDYEQGKAEGRYIAGGLPTLPFEDETFDLALCSHFLLLYSEQLSLEFHLESVRELCRVAREVRLFPLLELGSVPSRHLDSLEERLSRENIGVERVPVEYEFQQGGHTMMCCRKIV